MYSAIKLAAGLDKSGSPEFLLVPVGRRVGELSFLTAWWMKLSPSLLALAQMLFILTDGAVWGVDEVAHNVEWFALWVLWQDAVQPPYHTVMPLPLFQEKSCARCTPRNSTAAPLMVSGGCWMRALRKPTTISFVFSTLRVRLWPVGSACPCSLTTKQLWYCNLIKMYKMYSSLAENSPQQMLQQFVDHVSWWTNLANYKYCINR